MSTSVPAPTLSFVTFYVGDLDASAQFFAQTLGFTPFPAGDGPGFRQFAGGPEGSAFGLVQVNEQTPAPGEVKHYFRTGNIAALRDAWIANGATVSPIIQLPFGQVCEVVTPDGRTLSAWQP